MSHGNRVNRTTAGLAAAIVLPALLFTVSGCSGPAPMSATEGGDTSQQAEQTQPENTVMTIGLKFMPRDLTVAAGTTVTWQNGEAISHTVTSGAWGEINEATGLRGTQTPDGLFDHALAPKGQEGDSFSFTFDEPGEYLYYCQPHMTMNAMVTVTP